MTVDADTVRLPPVRAVRRLAFTREVSASIERCELTHLARGAIDVVRARDQHALYERALHALGCEIVRLLPLPEHPDAVFVEDTAVVFGRVAVLTRPGADSRRGEVASTAAALADWCELRSIEAPGTLDGGDVLRLGRRVYVGRTARTNDAAIAQLRSLLAPHGLEVHAVDVSGCLHLKTAVTAFADDRVVLNPAWVDRSVFADYAPLDVDPDEPFAANVLRVGERVLAPAAHPRTLARLRAAGAQIHTVPADELARAEGGVTCCSLIVEVPGA